MSKGSGSYYVCLFNNRLRDKINDLRLDGKITIEMEGIICSMIDIVRSTLNLKDPDKVMSFEEIRENYTKKIEEILSGTHFDLKQFLETLNVFVSYALLKIEDKRIEINKIKNKNQLISKVLLRTSIYLNECSAALLITNDFLNEIIDCENDADLEFLLMSSSNQE
jgi:hypothetical protein